MIQESLFKSNILLNIYNNLIYYFTYNNMYKYLLIILGILLLNWLLIAFFAKPECSYFMSFDKYTFNKKQKQDWYGLGLLFISFILYAVCMYSVEISVFNNFDSMTIDFIETVVKQGVKPVFSEWRFTPTAGIDTNIIYGISGNYYVMNAYVLLKHIFCLWLIYKFFDFIPVFKRFLGLALFCITPACLWVNNIIYPEQNILIFTVLSLFFLKKYQKNKKCLNLLWFVLFMNLALYTKETVILFYAGLGIYMLFSSIAKGKITINSFFSPIKTILSHPVEYMMFWSMFVFANCWMLITPFEQENRYIATHQYNIMQMIEIYAVELFLVFISFAILLYKIMKQKFSTITLLGEGSIIGNFISVIIIVFYMRISSVSDYPLSYYLYLPTVFCVMYIVDNITIKKLLGVVFVPAVLISLLVNYITFDQQQGKSRRDIAEYIISNAKYKDMVVYLYSTQIIDYKWWKTYAWSSALKYADPDLKLKFKTDLDIYKYYQREEDKFYEKQLGYPTIGDYVLVNKKNELNYHPDVNQKLVYENKFYQMYYVE